MKRIFFVSLCIIALFIFGQADALACGCFGQPTEPDHIAKVIAEDYITATAVFSGEAVSRKYVPIIINRQGEQIRAEQLIYKFKVDKLWKGNIEKEVIMPTSIIRYSDGSGSSGSNCIHSYFEIGKKYLIYANDSTDKLQASVCGRTKFIEKAETDIKELEKLKKERASKQKERNPSMVFYGRIKADS